MKGNGGNSAMVFFAGRAEKKLYIVDCIPERADGILFAIEIKRAESVEIQDFKGIQLLTALTGRDFAGGVVCMQEKRLCPPQKFMGSTVHILLQQDS